MKLIQRNYLSKISNLYVTRNIHDKRIIWLMSISSNNIYSNNEINIKKSFIQYFNTEHIEFNSKKELLYNLKNFSNHYNLEILPLKHEYSVYQYKEFSVSYWPVFKDWVIDIDLNDKFNNLEALNKFFKTRKEATDYIDELIKDGLKS